MKKSPAEQRAAFKVKYKDLNYSDKQWGKLVPKQGLTRVVTPAFKPPFTWSAEAPSTKKQAEAAASGWFRGQELKPTKCTSITQEVEGLEAIHLYQFDAVLRKGQGKGTLEWRIKTPTDKKMIQDANRFIEETHQELSRPEMYPWQITRRQTGTTLTITANRDMTSYVIPQGLTDKEGKLIKPAEKANDRLWFGESTYPPPETAQVAIEYLKDMADYVQTISRVANEMALAPAGQKITATQQKRAHRSLNQQRIGSS